MTRVLAADRWMPDAPPSPLWVPAITVREPWASLLVHGVKQFETRPRRSHFTGWLRIHAAARVDREAVEAHADLLPAAWVPNPGQIVGSVEVVACRPIRPPHEPGAGRGDLISEPGRGILRQVGGAYRPDQVTLGDFTPGRYALEVTNPATSAERCPACLDAEPHPVTDEDVDAPEGAEIPHEGWWWTRRGVRWTPLPCPQCRTLSSPHLSASGQLAIPWKWMIP